MESLVPQRRVDILIVGAHGPALRGLRTMLGDKLSAEVRGLRVAAKPIGVGLPASSVSVAKRVFQLFPRAVVHLGTCGVYPGLDYSPQDLLLATSIHLVDHSVREGHAEFPEPLQTNLATSAGLLGGLATCAPDARQVPIASALSHTLNDTYAFGMPEHSGCHGECLEAFSVALACHMAEIPFASVLAATHFVGSKGKEDWREFERDSTITAAEAITAWIAKGAEGLPHG